MRYVLVLLWIVIEGASSVDAALTLPLADSQDVDVLSLTQQMKRVVPALEGLSEDREHQIVELRRLTGEFTPEEEQQLRQVLTAHHAAAERENRKNQTTEIPLSAFGGVAGGLAGAASLFIVARKK